jgi:asparagine synthase (glutamine-hydrolysing)
MSTLRFTSDAKQRLFTDSAMSLIDDPDSTERILRYFNADNIDHVVDKMLYTDLMTRIPDHLLTIADRMTMAHSLESRSPLIDYKVVEFAASIPAGIKLKGNKLKYILRRVASRYMPSELVGMKKQGFRFPLGIWFRTDLKQFLLNLFSQSRFVELGIFEQSYIDELLNEHISGKVDHNYRIWVLLNLEMWYRMYFEGETVDSMREFTDRLA